MVVDSEVLHIDQTIAIQLVIRPMGSGQLVVGKYSNSHNKIKSLETKPLANTYKIGRKAGNPRPKAQADYTIDGRATIAVEALKASPTIR